MYHAQHMAGTTDFPSRLITKMVGYWFHLRWDISFLSIVEYSKLDDVPEKEEISIIADLIANSHQNFLPWLVMRL